MISTAWRRKANSKHHKREAHGYPPACSKKTLTEAVRIMMSQGEVSKKIVSFSPVAAGLCCNISNKDKVIVDALLLFAHTFKIVYVIYTIPHSLPLPPPPVTPICRIASLLCKLRSHTLPERPLRFPGPLQKLYLLFYTH